MPAEETHPHPDRRLIRERARAARQGLSSADRALLSRTTCERLIVALPAPFPHFVLGYAATGEELDPSAALDALRSTGSLIAYPRITGPGTLSLHTCTAGELELGPHGILQPPESSRTVSPTQIELVIVPGVAFDAHGNRLGYGGGYYDRLLAQIPHARRLGLCFDGQLAEEIPHEAHDVRMHVVITQSRSIHASS